MPDAEPVAASTRSASSRMLTRSAEPMLKISPAISLLSISPATARIVSCTWQNERVCIPSPCTSSGCRRERLLDEAGDDHPVLALLPGADGVEEAADHAVELSFLVEGEAQELVHGLRVRVEPAPFGHGAVDAAVVLLQRPLLAVVAVHLGARGDEDALAEVVAVLEHDLRALDVRDHRVHGLFDDQPHADRRRQVVDHVDAVDELADH